ncbi:LptA/OstA family protein [Nioella nitratireducens]|uniref:LptA/OstA family protein n=1 Tax=Nioella nitratireducens TaxID=1287720 RepID=UPI000A079575|nr:LptA/OstA family protein [Nioella nitratireducens]
MRALFSAVFLVFVSGLSAAAQMAVGFGGVPHDPTQQIEVTSDSLRVDQTTGNAVFSGNVIVIQGDLRMAAEEISVIYAETDGAQQIREVVATGGVMMTRGQDAAEGDRADYSVTDSLVVVSGNVLITQGRTTVAGDRLNIDLTTGNGTVEGRVRTVLQPEE